LFKNSVKDLPAEVSWALVGKLQACFQAARVTDDRTDSGRYKACYYMANVAMPVIFISFVLVYFTAGLTNTIIAH
jgi:hypothetical protein